MPARDPNTPHVGTPGTSGISSVSGLGHGHPSHAHHGPGVLPSHTGGRSASSSAFSAFGSASGFTPAQPHSRSDTSPVRQTSRDRRVSSELHPPGGVMGKILRRLSISTTATGDEHSGSAGLGADEALDDTSDSALDEEE